MGISEIRKSALLKSNPIDTEYKFDEVGILENVKNAYSKICDMVENKPKEKHSVEYHIGNKRNPFSELNAYIGAYNKQIKNVGYDKEIVAELSSFSNIGDPYFMDSEENRVRYFVKIREI